MSTAQPKKPHRPPRTPEPGRGSRPPRTTPGKKWPAAFSAQQQQLQQLQQAHHEVDNRSRGSIASASDSHATPTSVLLDSATPLTRNLSDLSGSYMGGNTVNYRGRTPSPSGAGGVPVHVYPSDQSDTSYQRPWRHAHVLSTRGPQHPQPRSDEENVEQANQLDLFRKSKVMVGPQGLVEVVAYRTDDSMASSIDSMFAGSQKHPRAEQPRIPLLILLMDPHRKVYELEQLWIDVETDTVRDVLHAVQLSLSDRWRQDYDGLFQVRNQTFNQLIHILNVDKYEVMPLEVWVAKPWAMSAKGTIQYATSLIQHLSELQILSYVAGKGYLHNEAYGRNIARNSPTSKTNMESVLTFTEDAAQRIHVAGGSILRHHHAHQFLSFSPPFEKSPSMAVAGVTAIVSAADDGDSMISDIQNSSVGSSYGDPDDHRPVSPSSSSSMTGTQEGHEVSIIDQIGGFSSPQKPKVQPVAQISPVVPHMTTAARLASQGTHRGESGRATQNHAATKAKTTPKGQVSRRARLAMLLCCKSEREDKDLRDGLRRNPTLETVHDWKPYWEEINSVGSGISDSRPLLLSTSGDLHLNGRITSRTRSDWC